MYAMVALAAALFMVLAGIVIKIMTPEGTVIVEVNVSDATILVSDHQGTVVIERQASQETVSLELEAWRLPHPRGTRWETAPCTKSRAGGPCADQVRSAA